MKKTVIIGPDSISGKSNLNTTDRNTCLKRDEAFVHGKEMRIRQAHSSADTIKLCSVILAICFWILQSINCLFPYTSEAITTFLTLWIINIIVVINSKQWENKLGVLHTKSEAVFWHQSSVEPFAALVIWSVILIPAQIPAPMLLIVVVMGKCHIWQVRADLSSAHRRAHCLMSYFMHYVRL